MGKGISLMWKELEFWLRSTHSSVPVWPGTLPLLPRIGMLPSHKGIKEWRCHWIFLIFWGGGGTGRGIFWRLKSFQRKMVGGCLSGAWETKLSRVLINSSTGDSCACRGMRQLRYSNKPYLVCLCYNYLSWRLSVPRHDDYRCYLLHDGKTSTLKTKQTWWLQ